MARVTALLIGLLLKDYTLQSIEAQSFQLPTRMKTLEGSCVIIPCMFTNVKPKPVIKWLQYRNGKRQEIYNSKNSSLVLKSYVGRVSLVGDLAKGNCTLKIKKVGSLDDGYYIPQVNSDPPTLKVESNDSVYLSSTDKPGPIWISSPGIVTEGKHYPFRCNARHTCPANPPIITWTSGNQPAKTHHIELPNGEWETYSLLTYKADWEHNGQWLKCKADYPNNKFEETLWPLRILYSPKMVSVQSSHETGRVRKGEEIELTCEGHANPDIFRYTWYKNNQTLHFGYEFKTLHINVTMEDTSGEYYCVAGNNVGETKSEPITLFCTDCELPRMLYWGGVVAAVALLLLIILAVVIVVWYRRRKKASMPPKPATTETSRDTNIYMNIQVSENPVPITESPYAALQTHNRCPDYEHLQLRDIRTTTEPSFQTPLSYSEYEEVIPFKSQKNAKRKY